ncbi:MAG: hypothetical protein Q4G27_04465 [Flavobacteriaceae bacterium]|nr:hypothetical protein [Flavobacteriaceae bacterium]
MSVEKAILKLLYRYDCVIVPEFGGFVAQQKSAEFHPLTYSFVPPRKVVSFNSDLVHSDGLLAHEIQNTEKINYAEALELIQQKVNAWNQSLINSETIEIAGLGTFKNNQNIIEFLPSPNQNFDLNTYGLSEVKGNYILRNESSQKKSEKAGSWMSYAAAIVFALMVGASGYFANTGLVQPQLSSFLPLLNDKFHTESNSTVPIAPIIDLNSVQSNEIIPEPNAVSTDFSSEITNLTAIEANSPELVVENNNTLDNATELDLSVKKYQIIGGSFKVYSQAMEHQAKLKREGYERAVIIGKVGSFFMVAFDTFHSENEALVYKRELEKKGIDVFMRP